MIITKYTAQNVRCKKRHFGDESLYLESGKLASIVSFISYDLCEPYSKDA